MMANTSDAGTTFVAAAITCASSGLPPTWCKTFGYFDFRRVPLPAAMMATAMWGAEDLAIGFNIPRGAGKKLKPRKSRVDRGTLDWVLSANALIYKSS